VSTYQILNGCDKDKYIVFEGTNCILPDYMQDMAFLSLSDFIENCRNLRNTNNELFDYDEEKLLVLEEYL